MKTALSCLLVCWGYFACAQHYFSLDNINSNNILQIIETPLMEKNNYSAIVQIGENNTVEKSVLSNLDEVKIYQIGDYNTTYYIDASHRENVKTHINTIGNNNYIDMVGSNSISENIKINVTGDDKMIFIRNY